MNEVINITFQSLQKNNGELYFYALLDQSQLSMRQRALPYDFPCVSIWKNVLKMNDESISPQLINLDTAKPITAFLQKIKPAWRNKPLYSLLVSPMPIETLAVHLGKYSICKTVSDGQNLILRFADTRILPLMKTALSEKQKKHFFEPITLWAYPDITGEWQYLEGGGQKETQPLQDMLELTDKQYETFLDGMIPYTVYQKICGHFDEKTVNKYQSFIWREVQERITTTDVSSPTFYLDTVMKNCLDAIENHIQVQNDTLNITG
ncbi:DUF4123 domain-containing protein [Neisseria dumasiana]|uniref:DUF4123 domain-containing protein n=1 Tax=Neisseria dumasiana TaxID=1931275 RepID=A0ABX3WKA3_9NEIS|nr:DUF4123 domain-containing protein [Neisseria dumasiana]OSI30322.1 hypothetical protein BV913_11005 [Neisseria dumasiana]UOO84592.1 DUF4123 domain-containing protein [Neisseria dumasiana]